MTLTIDLHRYHLQAELRRRDPERHHDGVVELRFLGMGKIDVAHHLLDKLASQRGAPRMRCRPPPHEGLHEFAALGIASPTMQVLHELRACDDEHNARRRPG